MRKISFLLIIVCITTHLSAQKKSVSYEQAFKGTATNITQPLPGIKKWVDEEHYIELRKDENSNKINQFLVEVKSGKASSYQEPKDPRDTVPKVYTSTYGQINTTASPDGKWYAFTIDNNLYIRDAVSQKTTQLTNDGSGTILNGFASWVYYEEILGRKSQYKAFWWSPDSKHICYMRFDDSQVPVFPIYWSDGQHGRLENERYPKAGDKNPEVKIGIAAVETGQTVWTDFNPKEDQYFGTPFWTPAAQLWIQWMPRSQDNLKVYQVDLANGAKKEIYDEKQTTWIELESLDRFKFLESGKGVIIKSDQSGWMHFYLYDMNGKLVNAMTNGDFTVGELYRVDEKAKLIYFNARKENSTRWDLYSASFDGKKLKRLSFGDYSFTDMNFSPGGKYFITSYSNIATPNTQVLMNNKGKLIRESDNAKGTAYNDFIFPKKELIRIKSGDGLFDLPVQISYPVNFDPAKRYPVLVSIYGGPHAGTVYDSWRMTAADIWWAQEGLIQVAFDNRSSGHFGKKGMNFIHRQLGKWEIEDYITCAKWMKAQPWVDGSKLCITGGSFGGYMTCMALTYGADLFTHGVANASVTDWRLYDTHYTERFMDTPAENPDGYKNTSPLTYVKQYKGLLRIVHGTSDDNVHMQNSIQMISALQDQKKHFEFMLYPGERHGIGANNQYKGLHNRTEAYAFYYKYLLNKEMPTVFWEK
jgi:dipeptidyl-peptidase 4